MLARASYGGHVSACSCENVENFRGQLLGRSPDPACPVHGKPEPAPHAAKVRRLAKTVAVVPRVRCVLFTEDGRTDLVLDAEKWIDDLLALIDECESDGAPIRAIRRLGFEGSETVAWCSEGWRIRADIKRAERKRPTIRTTIRIDPEPTTTPGHPPADPPAR